jgi:hypothetical protein
MIELLMGAGAIIAGLFAMIFWKDNKIEDLEQKNAGLEIKEEIREEQDSFKKEAIRNESARIKKKVSKKSKSSRRDRLNSL